MPILFARYIMDKLKPFRFSSMLLMTVLFTVNISSLASANNLPETISFLNVIENKDISMGEAASILQDNDGFMWFGGGATLIRYDGYEFREIFISIDDKPDEKIPVNFSRALFEDSHHKLWVGSRAGLLRYDPITERLIQIKDDPSQTIKISKSSILRIAELHTGEIIVASASGLFVVDPTTDKYTVITHDPQKKNGISGSEVASIYVENDDTFWLGTQAGLEKVNWSSKTFTLYKMNPALPDSIPENGVSDVVSDKEGKYWVATANGLVHFDPQTGEATRYQNNPNDRYSLGSSDIWKLLVDSRGILWVASDGGGVSVFDKEKNRFINHKFEAGRMGSISSNVVRTVYEDRNGDIWTGNFPVGVNFFDRSSAAIVSYSRDLSNPNSLGNNAINPVLEDKNGNLWLGIDGGGLDFFDRKKGEFTHFKMDPNDPTTLNGNSVLALCADSKGLIWTGVWGGGIASYNPVDKKFTRYPYDKLRIPNERVSTSSALNNAHVWSIREDANHEYWITTFAGGMSKYNPTTKQYTHYVHIDSDPESISSGFVWLSFEDSKGNLWAGASNGLNLMDKERKGSFKRFLPDPIDPDKLKGSNVLTLFEDSKKRLWIGTDGGLSLLDEASGKFKTFTKRDGFLNDTIRKIIEDADGVLWLGTNNGFSSFNPETKAIKNYNRVSGRLVGAISNNSGTLSKQGEVIFGGTNGLRIIKPSELSENRVVPNIAFTDFKIFSDSIAIGGKDGVLHQSINHTEKIVLDYKQSLFVVNFASLNYRDTGKNKYTYKLEGYDKDWMEPSNQKSAKYTNLDAGTYTLKVKGSNNDGVWNDQGKFIVIVQLPPPWKTWWAYSIYAAIALGIIGNFIYSQRRKRQIIEEQNRQLELKVAERTAEVREKSKNIQDMLTNMPQGLFTVVGDGEIHPEYSHYLESIFQKTDIAGKDVVEFLFTNANIGSDLIDSAKNSISAIVGEDEINFDFNEPLLIKDYDIDINGQQKYLSLDWSPIIVDGFVSKLMVSVRDVTLLKQMESAALQQKRQLEIVSQLLNIPAEKYLNFEASSLAYVKANREAISQETEFNANVIALLFRNMHTIKGNCRTFNFTHLSNTVHNVESTYSLLKSAATPVWQQEHLLAEIELVENAIAEYAHVYRAVLGRDDGAKGGRGDGFWMKKSLMDRIRGFLQTKDYDQLNTFVDQLNTVTLEKNLADVIASLPSIAAQLDKKAPQVVIAPNNVLIKESAHELLSGIFAHLLRNSVDHGLESTEERISKDKNPQGTISINATVKNLTLFISVQDDGRGLNLPALFKKGMQLGRWQENDSPNPMDIAQLIFDSGVSTKEAVSDISGRGVGMDAVKQFLIAQGGDVVIKLGNENATRFEFVPFELIVTLPDKHFILC